MNVSYLPDPHLRADWELLERMLERATEAEAFAPAIDVLWAAYRGDDLFGVTTTRLRNDGVAELRLVAGTRFRDWIGPMEATVSEWARAAGSPRVISRGRVGWVRLARTFGWAALGFDDEGKALFSKDL